MNLGSPDAQIFLGAAGTAFCLVKLLQYAHKHLTTPRAKVEPFKKTRRNVAPTQADHPSLN